MNGHTDILAIESSCDETAAAVIRDGREVLSNIIYTQIKLHTVYGGVVPEIASRKHIEKMNYVVQRALDKAVNAKYKAADRDSRKTLAAWRQALDQMYAARKELLELLYSGNDDTAQECLMNLYRDASIDATTAN